jgi:hypothetical protein
MFEDLEYKERNKSGTTSKEAELVILPVQSHGGSEGIFNALKHRQEQRGGACSCTCSSPIHAKFQCYRACQSGQKKASQPDLTASASEKAFATLPQHSYQLKTRKVAGDKFSTDFEVTLDLRLVVRSTGDQYY